MGVARNTNSTRESSKSPLQPATAGPPTARGLGSGSSLSPEAPRFAVSDRAETAVRHGLGSMPTHHSTKPGSLLNRGTCAGAGVLRMLGNLVCWG